MKKDPNAVKLGRKGGIARGIKLRAGLIPNSGAAIPKPTVCPRCEVIQPSSRAAWMHCRKARKKDER